MAHRFVAKSRFGATSSSARSSGDQREAVSCGLHVSGHDSGKWLRVLHGLRRHRRLRTALEILVSSLPQWDLLRLRSSWDEVPLPASHMTLLHGFRRSDPDLLLWKQPRSLHLWTPASASRSARPSRGLPGTRTRDLGGCTPTTTAAWTSTRSGNTGAAITVSANTTCSSLSRSTHSAPKVAGAFCSAATTTAGPGSLSRGVCGASPNGAVNVVILALRGHWPR